MKQQTEIYGPEAVETVAQKLVQLVSTTTIMTFQGPIGAGKTTLIRAFLRQLGVADTIVSPTFTYLSCYRTAQGRMVYHFDLYRIRDAEQFESLGFCEYLFEPGALILIEWPVVIERLLPLNQCCILLDYAHDPEKRTITIFALKGDHVV